MRISLQGFHSDDIIDTEQFIRYEGDRKGENRKNGALCFIHPVITVTAFTYQGNQ